MKLIDLSPEWLSPDVFIFRNPTGGDHWLTCKRVPMSNDEQLRLIYGSYAGEIGGSGFDEPTKWRGILVVTTKPESAWKFSGNDFNSLTVHPSIDASASGDWHGFIRSGEIHGGI